MTGTLPACAACGGGESWRSARSECGQHDQNDQRCADRNQQLRFGAVSCERGRRRRSDLSRRADRRWQFGACGQPDRSDRLRGNLSAQPVTVARHRLDEFFAHGFERLANLPDQLCQGLVRNHRARPQLFVEVVTADQLPTLFGQQAERVEGLWRTADLVAARIEQPALGGVEDESGESKAHFGLTTPEALQPMIRHVARQLQ